MTPVPSVQMQQGSLEAANLQPAETAVRLISVMRQFEMLQRAAALGSDLSRRTDSWGGLALCPTGFVRWLKELPAVTSGARTGTGS